MPTYYCPLCNQEVTKKVYEQITGIWQEKEKKLAALKLKEEALRKRSKEMEQKFKAQRQRLVEKHRSELKKQLQTRQRSFQAQIRRQMDGFKKEKKALEKRFQRQMATNLGKALREEHTRQRAREKEIKAQFERAASARLSKQMKKLDRQRKTFEKTQRQQQDRNEKLLKQYKVLQDKSEKQLDRANKKIKSLEEQIKKQATPQVLGLLEEKVFLKRMQEMFPHDEFIHAGKRGDIIHHVVDNDAKVGTIVYELKKVAKFTKSHVTQTAKAKRQRDAEYAILVTNARRGKDTSGFFMERGIIVIHPTGVPVLVGILRDHIVQMSRLRLSKAERNRMVRAVLEYIQGPQFKNSLSSIIQDTIDLYEGLNDEVKTHLKHWEMRLDRYRGIHGKATTIESKVVRLLVSGGRKRLPKRGDIEPIALPAAID